MSLPKQTSPPSWPAQAPLSPPPSHAGKRKRSQLDSLVRSKFPRAEIANETQINEAKQLCFDTNNAVYSCWPTTDTVVDQNWSTQFVWNSRLPQFTLGGAVDIALFRADTGAQVKTFENESNPSNRAGSIPVLVDDDWWGSDGPRWDGTETSFPFYFVVVGTGTPIASGTPQATFTAVQTSFPNSILASMASASASSAAAASSLSSISALSTPVGSSVSSSTGTSASGNVQNSNDDDNFPRWAIAVIVILGFFALAALVALIFLLVTRARRRRYDASRRGSMGSQSPMMANVQSGAPVSPQAETSEAAGGLGTGAGGGPTFGGGGAVAVAGKATSSAAHENDGESSISENLFSGADAAVMAEAFRKALRKPEFGDQPVEEGESPDSSPDQPMLLSRELAEEGRDIRSVGSSRGVRVETLSDGGGTATRSTPRNSTG